MSSSSSSSSENDGPSTSKKLKNKNGSGKAVVKHHRPQKYRKAWESMADFKGWLTEATGRNSGKAFCRACNTIVTAEITVIKKHSKSAKHVRMVKGIPKTNISDMFKKVENRPLDVQIKYAEIKLTGFLTEHNISFRCVDHLTDILKECFPDSKIAKNIKLHRTKATKIATNVLGFCSQQDINVLLKITKLSLIIDEATDIASVKTLCICVRFFHPKFGKIVTLFWNLIQLFSGDEPNQANIGATSERLFTAIRDEFSSKGIPLTNIIGFGSDGCNTMFGQQNSVASKLKDALPGVVVQKCICHSLHLCASEACKCLPRRCEDMARNIYNFFKNSAKRQAMFKEFQVFCDVDPHQILRPAQTRWLSLLSVVKRILEQWEPLRLFFTSTYIEHRVLASEEIYNDLNDKAIKLFYLFLEWVLPKFVDMNKYFQSEKVVIMELHTQMVNTYKDLLVAYMDPQYVRQTDIDKIDPANNAKFISLNIIYLGIGVLRNINDLTNDIRQDFYERCRRFLITSCLEIKKRYNFADPILSKLNMLKTCNIKHVNTLFPLMELLPRICDPQQDIKNMQRIDDQWRNLQNVEELPIEEELDVFYFKLVFLIRDFFYYQTVIWPPKHESEI
ncbi:hypothetical protein NQ317_012440 [Molorchus minor]|uniref:DUF4371 domain-containing protein n=1 Tax=Molorchus minor TaxID=1323400 RepID=A0ABQ9ISZ2_9CUCU|nr:hypothetical protein NQ317_012440 [Molorchus minor]